MNKERGGRREEEKGEDGGRRKTEVSRREKKKIKKKCVEYKCIFGNVSTSSSINYSNYIIGDSLYVSVY